MNDRETSVGRLVFPLYNGGNSDDTKWMKRVYLYVGKHQRLTGEVKKLPKALGIIRKREMQAETMNIDGENQDGEELEIVEIVKFKVVFSHRPEPVSEE